MTITPSTVRKSNIAALIIKRPPPKQKPKSKPPEVDSRQLWLPGVEQ
jgi:hypothetical protein